MSLYSLNCVSLSWHCLGFNDTVSANSDVLILSETRMGDEQHIDIPNFNLITQKQRKEKPNAGVAIYQNAKDHLNVLQCFTKKLTKLIETTESKGIKIVASDAVVDICSAECILKDGRKIFLICTYISPGQQIHKIEQFLFQQLLPYTTTWSDVIKKKSIAC